jgi:3-methyl-2-oxobutanoate hydroxymethyltransferase
MVDTAAQKPRSVDDLFSLRKNNSKLTWLTAYDFPSGYCAEKAGIDMILVGDSGAMVQYGMPRTSGISMDLMIEMCKAVRLGAPHTLIVGDMPRGSYEVTSSEAISNAFRFVIEGNADLIKLEGASSRILESVHSISEAGVPVIGHIGLTPQSLGTIQPYKVTARVQNEMEKLKQDVEKLIAAGAVAILVEAVPPNVTKELEKLSTIPIYGIGAGIFTNGQLLIYHDLVGYFPRFKPKFAKNFAEEAIRIMVGQNKESKFDEMDGGVGEIIRIAIECYIKDVKGLKFPSSENCYADIDSNELKKVFGSNS